MLPILPVSAIFIFLYPFVIVRQTRSYLLQSVRVLHIKPAAFNYSAMSMRGAMDPPSWTHLVGDTILPRAFLRDLCMQLSLFHDFEEEVIYGTRKMQVEICLSLQMCSVMMFRIQFLARTLITRRLF